MRDGIDRIKTIQEDVRRLKLRPQTALTITREFIDLSEYKADPDIDAYNCYAWVELGWAHVTGSWGYLGSGGLSGYIFTGLPPAFLQQATPIGPGTVYRLPMVADPQSGDGAYNGAVLLAQAIGGSIDTGFGMWMNGALVSGTGLIDVPTGAYLCMDGCSWPVEL